MKKTELYTLYNVMIRRRVIPTLGALALLGACQTTPKPKPDAQLTALPDPVVPLPPAEQPDPPAQLGVEAATAKVTEAFAAAEAARIKREAAMRAALKDPTILLDPARRGPRDLVITAVGDVSQPTKSWTGLAEEMQGKVFAPTLSLLQSGDLISMNLENPVSTLSPSAKKEYSFTSNPDRLDWYIKAGFNMFSLSNNHIADADQEGIDDTIRHLKERSAQHGKPVYFAGAGKNYEEAEAPVFIKLPEKNLTVAFFSTGFSQSPNVSRYWSRSLLKRIKEAKARADIVVVAVHAGREYRHVPGADIKKVFHGWIDHGADVVIGHHPHVVQPAEQYKHGVIMYSLGNFVFFSKTYRHKKFGAKLYGLMARVVIRDAKVAGVQLVPLWVNNTDNWKLPTGEHMPSAQFTPKVLKGRFADAFFEDFNAWSREAGLAVPERVGDVGFIRVPPQPARSAAQ